MILVAYWHGLRASEVVALTADAFEDGYLTVQRLKGSNKTVQLLIRHADPLLDEATGLFDYMRGMAGNQRLFNVSRVQFWRLVQRYAKAAGIPKHKAHPPILKHSIAMQTIDRIGIQRVKQQLGHKSGSSTMEYLKVSDDEASRAVQGAADELIV